MCSITDLYHQSILNAARSKLGSGRLSAPSATAVAHNSLCGDRITVDVIVDSGRLEALAHEVRGCILCQAAAVVLTRRVAGAEVESLRDLEAKVSATLASRKDEAWGQLPELAIFKSVQAYPSRRRCISLPYEALGIALQFYHQ